MKEITIQKEYYPIRCEVCHQTDLFNAETNDCLRCNDIAETKSNKYSVCNIKIPNFLIPIDNSNNNWFKVISNIFFYLSALPYIFLFFTESINLILGSNVSLMLIGILIVIIGKIRGESVSKTFIAAIFAGGLIILIALCFIYFNDLC